MEELSKAMEEQFHSLDFSNLMLEIRNVAQKYFKHWASLRGENVACVDDVLIDDFKRGIFTGVDWFWDPKNRDPDSCTRNDLRLIKEGIGSELNQIWNDRYLDSPTDDQMVDFKFARILLNYFSDAAIKEFIIKNKDKFPAIKTERSIVFDMKFKVKVLICKIEYYIKHREWPWWIK